MRRRLAGLAQQMGLDWYAAKGSYALEIIAELGRADPQAGPEFVRRAEALILEIELEAARAGRLFAGVRPVLARLGGLGLKLAVITRNCRQAVEIVFPDVEEWCHLFVPREETTKPKPSPEHLLTVLHGLGLPAERCLMVGDHPIDVATARAVGAWACGLTTGRIDAVGLAEADLVFDSLEELAEALSLARERAREP